MRKFKKNIITHQPTNQLPFALDFLKTLFYVSMFLLAAVGVYALINPGTQELLMDQFTLAMEYIAKLLGL